MKRLESIINKGKILFLAGIASLAINCASIKPYVEPKLGLIAPVAEKEQDYTPSFLVGGACGVNKKEIGLDVEVGLDYFHSSAKSDDPEITVKTNSILPRASASFYPLNLFLTPIPKLNPYIMAGINVLGEFTTIDIPKFNVHEEVSNATFGLEFGIGATLFDRIHTRLSYTMLPASENVKGMITLTGGYRFSQN